jgi:hypothetical protein
MHPHKRAEAFAKRLAAKQRKLRGQAQPPRPVATLPTCPRCQQPITDDRCYICADDSQGAGAQIHLLRSTGKAVGGVLMLGEGFMDLYHQRCKQVLWNLLALA